jgi:hypothetical protein
MHWRTLLVTLAMLGGSVAVIELLGNVLTQAASR